MSHKFLRQKKMRGSILLLAIFFLIVLFSLAVTFFRIIPAEFHSATQARHDVQGQYAADAGIRKSVEWLKNHDARQIDLAMIEDFNAANNDPTQTGNVLDKEWSFTSEIDEEQINFLNRIYVIKSTAYFRGRPVREAVSTVQNESFAKFALFLKTWLDNLTYTMTPEGIQGPVYTGDYFQVAAGTEAYWTALNASGDPTKAWISGPKASMMHSGAFTAGTYGGGGDGNKYMGGNFKGSNPGLVPFDENGSPDADRYAKIVQGGREKMRQVQEIALPRDNANLRDKAWGNSAPPSSASLKAYANARGNLLVQTNSGEPNVPGAVVTGGIFIAGGKDANEVQLQLTPEGHQKTRVRQDNTKVPGPPSTSYEATLPKYKYPYQRPPEPIYTWKCTKEGTRKKDVTETYNCDYQETSFNGAMCGYEDTFVPGEGGVISTIKVPIKCTYTVKKKCTRVIGQVDEKYCITGENVQTGTQTFPLEWKETYDGTVAGAVVNGTYVKTDSVPFAGSTPVVSQTEKTIQNWNSVVEVNEKPYQIPYFSGMKINGDTITSASDPRLTVPKESTVSIKNDYETGGVKYAEYTVMQGTINGVIFSDENLYGLRGTAKGSYYKDAKGNLDYHGKVIATNIGSDAQKHTDGKDIQIRDSILQYYDGTGTFKDENGVEKPLNDGQNRLALGNTSPDKKHILGIIGRNVDLTPSSNPSNYENTDVINNINSRRDQWLGGKFDKGINVYAIIMAGVEYDEDPRPDVTKMVSLGGFGAHTSAMKSTSGIGDFNLYGGIISAMARLTQTAHGGGAKALITAGFRQYLNYDEVAAYFLENFPVTNTYTVLRYVSYTKGSTGQI